MSKKKAPHINFVAARPRYFSPVLSHELKLLFAFPLSYAPEGLSSGFQEGSEFVAYPDAIGEVDGRNCGQFEDSGSRFEIAYRS
jgi:hypothetical protein